MSGDKRTIKKINSMLFTFYWYENISNNRYATRINEIQNTILPVGQLSER